MLFRAWHGCNREILEAIMITNKYLTPNFAEELGMKMGCTAERARMPDYEFLEDSLKPPPLYFETDERLSLIHI